MLCLDFFGENRYINWKNQAIVGSAEYQLYKNAELSTLFAAPKNCRINIVSQALGLKPEAGIYWKDKVAIACVSS